MISCAVILREQSSGPRERNDMRYGLVLKYIQLGVSIVNLKYLLMFESLEDDAYSLTFCYRKMKVALNRDVAVSNQREKSRSDVTDDRDKASMKCEYTSAVPVRTSTCVHSELLSRVVTARSRQGQLIS